MNILQVPTDKKRLAKRKAIKDGTAPFRKRNKAVQLNTDLPFTQDLNVIERAKTSGELK